jgi:hypothetical protein
VASHQLIDTYLALLGPRLPSETVAELADGLTETFERYRLEGLDPDGAAHAAIAEFGRPERVLREFVRQAPGRRVALLLLACGPVVGFCWAAALISARAWAWPIPMPVRLSVGVALVAVIGLLVLAATAANSYRRTELAQVAAVCLVGLDATMVGGAFFFSTPLGWATIIAIIASVTRLGLTVGALGRMRRR